MRGLAELDPLNHVDLVALPRGHPRDARLVSLLERGPAWSVLYIDGCRDPFYPQAHLVLRVESPNRVDQPTVDRRS